MDVGSDFSEESDVAMVAIVVVSGSLPVVVVVPALASQS